MGMLSLSSNLLYTYVVSFKDSWTIFPLFNNILMENISQNPNQEQPLVTVIPISCLFFWKFLYIFVVSDN